MGQNFVVLTLNRLFYFKLFLIVLASFAVRIWLIDQFASPVPYWDQWDAEAVYTFIPWFDGNLTIGNLIAPHNEHRLFFTRISSLGLLILNDMQWDPWVQMVFCAGLAILNLWVLALILKQLLGERGYNVSLFAVALLGLIPFAAENIIWGLQVNWYLFNLFSLIAFWGVLLHREGSWRWGLGMICALLTYFNLVSGIFVAAMLLLVKSYQWLIDSKNRERYLLSLVVLGILIGIEIVLFSDFVGHVQLRHQAAADHGFWQLFFTLLGKYLAFPFIVTPYMSIIMYLPVIILSIVVFIKRRHPNALEIFSLTLGGWVILQAAAMVYGRLWIDTVAFRYMDILALGTIANLLALYALYDLFPKRYDWTVKIYGVLWGIAWCSMLGLFTDIIPFLQNKLVEKQEVSLNMRNYLATNSITILQNTTIPYPKPQRLADILAHPKMKSILPSNLQMPDLVNAEKNEGIFIQNQTTPAVGQYQNETVWGSAGIYATGTFVSEPITTIKHQYLQIPLAGYLGTPGLQLQLLVEGQPPITITPPKVIGESWSSYYMRTPTQPFRIIATDQNVDSWFAFGMPRGVGVLSFWTMQLLNYSEYLMLKSLGLLLALIFTYSYLKPETLIKPEVYHQTSA